MEYSQRHRGRAIPEGYTELGEVINFARFHFNVSISAIKRQEVEILEPQLVALGYSNITWMMGEVDSFGPLSRLCHAENAEGKEVTFIYG